MGLGAFSGYQRRPQLKHTYCRITTPVCRSTAVSARRLPWHLWQRCTLIVRFESIRSSLAYCALRARLIDTRKSSCGLGVLPWYLSFLVFELIMRTQTLIHKGLP